MVRFYRSFLVFIVLFIIIFFYASAKGDLFHSQSGNTKNTQEFITIQKGDIITQYLYPKHLNVEELTLAFNPNMIDTNFRADITVSSNNATDEFHISSTQMDVLGQIKLPLSKGIQSNEQKLKIVISNINYDGKKEISIKAAQPFENEMVAINNETINNKALVITYSLSSVPYWKLSILLVLAIFVAGFLSYAGKSIIKEYIVLAAVFGTLFAIFTPIHQASDEYVHYLKSQDVAQGHLITPKYGGLVGYDVSRKILDTEVAPIERDEKFNPDVFNFIHSISVMPDNQAMQVFTYQPTTAVYTFIPYIPQAIGIKIAMMFNTDIWTANILGRLTNLFIFIAMSSYALFKMPVMRRTFMFFMLAPIIMFHASSLSADTMLMGFSFIYFSLLMKLWFESDTMVKRDRIFLALSGCLMALCKFTYWPLLLLLLLVSPKRFGSKKKYTLFNSIVIGGAMLLVAGWNVFVMSYVGDAVATGNVSANKQLTFIIQNPIEALQVLIRSFDHGLGEWAQMYNTFGFLSTPLIGIQILYPIIIVLVAVLDHQDRPFSINRVQKWGLRITAISVTILVMLSLYLTWTTVGNQYVYGVQGRYFIPVIPVLLLLVRQHFTLKVDKPNIPIFASRAAVLFLTYSFLFWFAKLY